jgi:hypothetical protein
MVFGDFVMVYKEFYTHIRLSHNAALKSKNLTGCCKN